MSPFGDDYRSTKRFIDLPNGSVALLNSCYDLFGTADIGTGNGARRAAIRTLRHQRGRLMQGDEGFRSTRDAALLAWANLVAAQEPDVLLATIHAFERPGLDGYWQRHGIARASASRKGALTLGAAHFLESLPRDGSTLAACNVPRRELTAGVERRAHSLAPIHSLPLTTPNGNALLRLFEPSSGQRKAKKGRTA